MSYYNFKSHDNSAGSKLKFTSPDLVNPLYKPKTLGELKAEMVHTGINPAPVALRTPLPESDVIDAIDAPSVRVGGDVFENIRESRRLNAQLSDNIEKVKAHKESMKQSGTDESKDKSLE